MKYRVLLWISLLVTPASLLAQEVEDRRPQTSVYFEGLGNAGLYSLNVDRTLSSAASVRVGVSRWSGEDFLGFGSERYLMLPVMASYLIGKGNGKLEIGGGLLLGRIGYGSSIGEERNPHWLANLTGVIGYRNQREEGGVMVRAGLTPFYSFDDEDVAYPDSGFLLSLGVSLGYTFKSSD